MASNASLRVEKPLPPQRGFLETFRTDLWWVQPAITLAVYGFFIVYVNWAIMTPTGYWFENYLGPVYSPELFGDSPHSWFGPKPGWWPGWLFFSPALLVMWAPAGFRMTCYFYRGSYYKAFWGDPPACGVGEPRKTYWGENTWPLLIQNSHRYFMYVAVMFLPILAHDAWVAMWFPDGNGGKTFGLAAGSVIITINFLLLSSYLFSCHSLRHVIGGYLNQLSRKPVQAKAYSCVSCMNKYHPYFAWSSLLWVLFTDIYIRLLANGIVTDIRFF
ncbi:MAG: succinate dehydrogenase [Bdellovibrionia bacterium]